MNFLHYFIEVPRDKDNNYIIDLTYEQFKYNELFDDIYNNGYQLLSNDEYNIYLSNIGNISKKR